MIAGESAPPWHTVKSGSADRPRDTHRALDRTVIVTVAEILFALERGGAASFPPPPRGASTHGQGRRSIATALFARDGAAALFDRSGHHAALLLRTDGNAAWTDADGGI
jgi:hypothetical protein